ncbi:J domain-containing protein [Geomonas sp. RF6]|uniref:DnaJ C-terminal domain-containing protein n=1 Tax=Geomonas sp. RF6 TaxID=2897342 RepID=UPI001E44ABDF|nr:J domain-containing protein [Geomonas sp. RF6]UFS72521.1 J domain-containing protein [Geomonas sp. RF6]
MAATYQDYYKTLGVGKTASQDEIQKAYRKLARKYHPDINKAADAEENFKGINEAYEVLGDPQKRQMYDQYGSAWSAAGQGGQGFRPPPGGHDTHYSFRSGDPESFSQFFQDLFGGGWEGHASDEMWGGGVRRHRGRDHEATLDISLHDAFHGGKKTVQLERLEYEADGRAHRVKKSYEVNVPRGVTEGSLIRLAGQGGLGSGGGADGDLFLKVHILPDPRFQLQEHDLVTTLKVSPWEAALGAKVPVPTVDGLVNLSIPPGTQSGQTLRLRGKGMPITPNSFGDLLAEVHIMVPSTLSSRERELLEELARESRFNPRQ